MMAAKRAECARARHLSEGTYIPVVPVTTLGLASNIVFVGETEQYDNPIRS